MIAQRQLEEALAEQKRTNEKLGTALVRLGFIGEEQLVQILSSQYGVPIVRLSEMTVDPEIVRLVPAWVAKRYELIPVQRTNGALILAMADPINLSALDEVAFTTGLQVVAAIAPLSEIRKAIGHFYETPPSAAADLLTEAEAELDMALGGDGGRPIDPVELRASAERAPVVRFVDVILVDAISRGASDIHMEPYQDGLRVRLRLDGILHQAMTVAKRLEPAITSRIKIMADLDIAERRLPQDGSIKFRYQSREIDLRVSILPAIFGEGVSIRILDKETVKLDLTQLGFDPWSLEQIQTAVHSPYGIILITGPTGSGKTTTLYSAISTVNSGHINIMTVEDPVEYILKGVNQIQVNEQIGRTFAAVLRSFLRHDPDVILVGEMRDLETAQVAVRAALTGHLVLSTLHTNDCPSTIDRLLDMGIPAFLVSSSLRLILAQRLVRKVCTECRELYEVDEESLIPYGHVPQGRGKCTMYRGKGCKTCNFTGMKGRVAICEAMPITKELRERIMQHAPTAEIREIARRQGMKTLREAGLLKAIEGITTVAEVLRATAE
ncbi:MAG: GspE/PulE family protein [Nitrospiraceae bacterium]